MWNDPVVDEVRKAGKDLAHESGDDIKAFFSNLRKAQEQYSDRLAVRAPLDIKELAGKETTSLAA